MEEMKMCCTCKCEKPVSEFNKKKANKDGLERYCKECHRARNRHHYTIAADAYKAQASRSRKAISEWWVDYKSALICSICGESRHWCLDFHHTDPLVKEGTLSSLLRTASKQRVLDEIAKCVVVCRNCHADIHYHQQ